MTEGERRSRHGWVLTLLASAWPSWASAGLSIPAEWRTCRSDADCAAVFDDCCPAGAPQSRTAVNRSRLQELEVLKSSACAEGSACRPISGRRHAWEAGLKPSCQSRRCCLVEDLPLEPREQAREQEQRDTAWLEDLRTTAVAVKDADRALAGPGLSARRKASLKGRRRELLARLDAAAKANASNYLAQTYLGQVFLGIAENGRALSCATRALEMAPRESRALVLRGLANHRLGRRDAAAADVREALKLDPGDKAALDLQAMISGPRP
ncbi:MAG: hypothetical protein HY924_03415 [Elusimicrobia bacterium]|nr:hypothetical protein [Elusimicrobiota bacterium]